MLLDEDPGTADPSPVIGKVNLKTVAVAPETPTAAGVDELPEIETVELSKDDLFDLDDNVDLTGDLEEE